MLLVLYYLLLTDPLNDSYSFISLKHANPEQAFQKFKGTFLTQLGIQSIFIIIVFFTPSILLAFIISSIIGLSMVLYDYNNRLKTKTEVLKEMSK